MGFFQSIGAFVDHALLLVVLGYAALLLISPRSRDNLLAFFTSKMPAWDRLKALVAGLLPSPHSPPAAVARKAKRDALKTPG